MRERWGNQSAAWREAAEPVKPNQPRSRAVWRGRSASCICGAADASRVRTADDFCQSSQSAEAVRAECRQLRSPKPMLPTRLNVRIAPPGMVRYAVRRWVSGPRRGFSEDLPCE